MSNQTIAPFIQWVGGKRNLAKTLSSYIPSGLNNYYEPFLGGGALFFNVHDKFQRCFLSDINLELVTSYNAIKNDPGKVSALLKEHEANHSKEYFYQSRDSNNSNNPSEIGAKFLYLNRYSFRGIYRINNKGVSTQSYSTRVYSKNNSDNISNNLKACSHILQNKATICANDFSFIDPESNDFVYFDPPYHSSGEGFYTRAAFNEQDQIRLRDFAKGLTNRGVKVLLSNSDTEFIRQIYKDFYIQEIDVNYSIRYKNKSSSELVISNYGPLQL